MKPMLAATCDDVGQLKFPLYASPKLDGVRAIVTKDGKLLSRSLKPVPNKFVNGLLTRKDYAGMDGELIYGPATAKDVYRQTVSITGSDDKVEGRDIQFHVFDRWDLVTPFKDRNQRLSRFVEDTHITVVPQETITDVEKLLAYEAVVLDQGYEGLILRSPDGKYKFGRSTLREQGMLKLKRFTDSEAEIIEVQEEEHNANAAKRNALGRTERSTAQAGMVRTGRAGALQVRDVNSGVEFGIGTGLCDADREFFWKHRKAVVGKLIKYKSFLVGVKDKPRFPVYLGPREEWDL